MQKGRKNFFSTGDRPETGEGRAGQEFLLGFATGCCLMLQPQPIFIESFTHTQTHTMAGIARFCPKIMTTYSVFFLKMHSGQSRVMRVGSDTLGDPFIQKGLTKLAIFPNHRCPQIFYKALWPRQKIRHDFSNKVVLKLKLQK